MPSNNFSTTMADFNALLEAYDAPVQTVERSVTDHEAMNNLLDIPEELAASIHADTDLSKTTEAQDIGGLSHLQFIRKYGEETANRRFEVNKSIITFNDKINSDRTNTQIATDAGLDVTAGVTGTVGSTASLIAGGLEYANDKIFTAPMGALADMLGFDDLAKDLKEDANNSVLGPALAQGSTRITEAVKSYRSDEINDQTEAAAVIRKVKKDDRQTKYNKSISNGDSSFVAGLSQIGGDIFDELNTLIDNPAQAGSVAAEGIGSLVAFGTAGKFFKAGVTATIAATEGGGAYVQAATEVMEMTEEELTATSKEYVKLRSDGMAHRDAKSTIANNAGMTSASIAAPTAALISKVPGLSEFENKILKGTPIKNAVTSIAGETVEEAAQGAVSQIASNIGVQTTAKPDKQITKDLGETIAQGAVGGLGTAGIVQSPAVAKQVVKTVAKPISKSVDNRVEKVKQNRDDKSPTGNKATEAAVEATNVSSKVDDINFKDISTDPENTFDDKTKQVIETNDTAVEPSRISKFVSIAKALASKDSPLSADEKQKVNLHLVSEKAIFESFVKQPLPDHIEKLDDTDPVKVDAIAVKENIKTVLNSDILKVDTDIKIDSSKFDTQDVVKQATHFPGSVDINQVNKAITDLNQKNKTTGEDHSVAITVLQAAYDLATLKKKVIEDTEPVNDKQTGVVGKSQADVDQEVLFTGKNFTDKKGEVYHARGLEEYVRDINVAIQTEDFTDAQIIIEELADFSKNYTNKINAYNESINADGKFVTYDSYTPFGLLEATEPNAEKAFVIQGNENSVKLAQNAMSNAHAVTNLYNKMLFTHKNSLTGSELSVPVLDDKISLPEAEQIDLPLNTPQPVKTTPTEPTIKKTEPSKEIIEEAPEQTKITVNNDRFNKAYTINPDKSVLVGYTEPYEQLKGSLTLGQSAPAAAKVINFIDYIVPKLHDKLNKRLSKVKYAKGKQESVLDKLNEGIILPDVPRFTALHVIDQDTNQYDKRLIEQAGLAAVDWILTSPPRSGKSPEEVAKEFNIQGQVPDELITAANFGIKVTRAKEDLGRKIAKYWGVDINDVSQTDTIGIAEGVAAEILSVMSGNTSSHPLETKTFNYTVDGKPRAINVIRSNQTQEDRLIIGKDADLINRTVLGEKANYYSIGEKIETLPNKHRKDKEVKTSDQQKQSAKFAQDTEYHLDTDMFDMVNRLGKSVVLKLLGTRDLDDNTLNEVHKQSLKGQAISFLSGWDSAMEIAGALDTHATENKLDIGEVSVYFPFNFSSANRLTAGGGQNPQSNKLVRALLSSIQTEMDLTNSQEMNQFMKAVVQNLDVSDVKIDKLTDDQLFVKFYELLDEFNGAIVPMSEWYDRQQSLEDHQEMTSKEVDTIIAVLGTDVPIERLHALNALAKYNYALNHDGLATFKNSLPIELDGKSDGPINFIMHMATGLFTNDWADIMQKGGMYLGNTINSFNDFSQNSPMDLYEHVGAIFKNKIGILHTDLQDEFPQGVTQLSSLISLMDKFADIEITSDEIIIGRKTLKNPVTIIVYGASMKGIVNQVSNTLLDTIYENMSENDPLITDEFMDQHFKNVFGTSISKFKGKWISSNIQTTVPNVKDRINFKFSKENIENFEKNIRHLIATPMMEAITIIMQEPLQITNDINVLAQINSIIQIDMFNQAHETKLKEQRGSKIGKYQALSKKDYDELFADIAQFNNIIEFSDQTINSGIAKSSETHHTLSDSLDEKLTGGASLPVPTGAGVRSLSRIIQSIGDALMIDKINLHPDIKQNITQIFDGINVPPNLLQEYSNAMNQVVLDNWLTENPVKVIADSFAANHQIDVMDRLSSEAKKDLFKLLGIKTINEVKNKVRTKVFALHKAGNSIQARKNTLKQYNITTDHLTGSGQGYVQEGKDFVSIDEMNETYNAEHVKLVEQSQNIIEPENTDFVRALSEEGIISKGGVINVSPAEVLRVLKRQKTKLDKRTQQLLRTFGDKLITDFDIIIGSKEQLISEYGLDENSNGNMSLEKKRILIANGSVETVLHELIHSATAQLIHDYYNNPQSLSKEYIDAIQRLEELMNVTRLGDYKFNSKGKQDAMEAMLSEVNSALALESNDGKYIALNEFIAWSLTNQKITDVGIRTRIPQIIHSITQKVVRELSKLFGIKASVGRDMFSNVLFNAVILASEPSQISDTPTLNQIFMKATNKDQRKDDLAQAFNTKIAQYVSKEGKYSEHKDAVKIAERNVNIFISSGFNMDIQSKQLFKSMQVAMATEMEFDKLALSRVDTLYKEIMKDLHPDDFTDGTQIYSQAVDKYDALVGNNGLQIDAYDRTTLLSSFLALSQVDDGFRKILEDKVLKKSIDIKYGSLNETLETTATSLMDALSVTVTKEGLGNRNTKQALDKLSVMLSAIEDDKQNWLEGLASKIQDGADDKVSQFMNNAGNKLGDLADEWVNQSNSNSTKSAGTVAQFISAALSKNRAKTSIPVAMTMIDQMNIPLTMAEVISEAVGRTDENKAIVDMVSKVRTFVSALRQVYRDDLPKFFISKFNKILSDKQWSHIYHAIGRTDLAAIFTGNNTADVTRILSNQNNLTKEINKVEAQLKSISGKYHSYYLDKSKQLAKFMNTGIAGHNLLRNADAVSHLLNEGVNVKNMNKNTVQILDSLISLYALDTLNQDMKDSLFTLVQSETDGIISIMRYSQELRKEEFNKSSDNIAVFNGYKGFIPNEKQDGVNLVVVDDAIRGVELLAQGYIRKGDYIGSGIETGKFGYYYSSVAGKNTYTQGAMQTVQRAYNGIDPRTGKTVTGNTAGIITGTDAKKINARYKHKKQAIRNESLIPVFDKNGEVFGYERTMNPEILQSLNKNTHLGEMLGAWKGRQKEEEVSQAFNTVHVNNIYDIWKKDSSLEKNAYINIATSKDPVYADTWNVIPPETKEYIESKFGKDTFMVRKTMVNNALGYRNAGIADAWSNDSRMNQKTKDLIVKTSTFFMGDKAFQYLVTGEKGIQTAVSFAKQNIVIKSVVVPAMNSMSNVLQLMTRGVPITQIYKSFRSNLGEINQHLRNVNRRVRAEAELLTVQQDPIRKRKLEIELKALDDSDKRMFIYPLIEAGEFSTISEGLTEIDEALTTGKWVDWVEGQVNRLPDGLKTVGKNAIIARDTALYKGLSRAVQYGDFLAKAALYEHSVKQGMVKEEAMGLISEEFVNFDLPPGRVRSYTEAMGITWFWNFKIRSMKVAMRMMRDNPVRALILSTGSPIMPDFGAGTPISDNFLSVTVDGRLGYSTGWGMLWSSIGLNPWVNLMN
ncbi:MAG: hypothetical protein COA63_014165 [Methylophaga sp.]|nr:hypothetical protein [Methylophaga sp.]